MKVALLLARPAPGAGPDDLDTLAQAEALARALAGMGHDVVRVHFSLDLPATARELAALAPDAVVNLVESIAGSARFIHLAPALLEDLGLPFTGADQAAVLLSNNKLLGKRLLAPHGIPTPAWIDRVSLLRGGAMPAGKLIVKSVTEHASVGLDDECVVEPPDAAGLAAILDRQAARHGGEWFAESYAPGREFNLALLDGPEGPRALPPAEMVFTGLDPDQPRVVGFAAKWDESSPEYAGTVRSFDFPEGDSQLLDALGSLALRTWRAFGLAGYARVDFRVDGLGRPQVIDVNANPCLSPDAGFAAALARAGITYSQAVALILNLATARTPGRRRPECTA